MQPKFRLSVIAVMLALSGTANSTPVTFQFDIPAWTSTSDVGLFGNSASLLVTLDNGTSTYINQSYLNTSVISTTLTSNGGSFNHTWTGDMAYAGGPNAYSASYISTDETGTPTLNLLATADLSLMSHYVFWDYSSNIVMQWGILGSSGGAGTFSISDYGNNPVPIATAYAIPWSNGAYLGFSVEGQTIAQPIPPAIPEPMPVALMALGLPFITLLRKRKAATTKPSLNMGQ